MRSFLLTSGLVAILLAVPALVSAQQGGNRGNTGSSGFGNTGSSGFGSSGFGSTNSGGFGSTGFGSTGSSGFGSSGLGGQTGFGQQQGMGGQTGFGNQNQMGGNANGFLGRNMNQNQLLGRNTGNQGMGGNSDIGRGGGGNRGGGNRGANGLNALNQLNGGGGGGNANQAPLVRPRQRVAFDYPTPVAGTIQTTLEARLTKVSLKSPGLKSVMLAIEDKGEVVLRGQVNSAAEAKLAENLLRLEPGVRTVRNELTYPAAAPATDE